MAVDETIDGGDGKAATMDLLPVVATDEVLVEGKNTEGGDEEVGVVVGESNGKLVVVVKECCWMNSCA